jgi:hypothetical protein
MSNTTFSGPVTSNNGFIGDVVGATQVPTYTVANAVSAAGIAGTILAFSDGTNWKRSDTGATISAI